MLSELVTSVHSTIRDRLFNPLSGSFILAWSLYNYEVLLFVFSGMDVYTKIASIELYLYPKEGGFHWLSIIVPLCISLIYIFAYPFPARFVMLYSLRQKRIADQRRNEELGLQLLTSEESDAMRTRMAIMRDEYKVEISKKNSDIEHLESIVKALQESSRQELGEPGGAAKEYEVKNSNGRGTFGKDLVVIDGLTDMQSLIVLSLYDNPGGVDADHVVSGVLSKLPNEVTAGDIYGALDFLQDSKLVIKSVEGGYSVYYLEKSMRDKIYLLRQR